MSVLVRVEAQAKPGEEANLVAYLQELLPVTRTREGCRGAEIYRDLDDATVFALAETWDSREQYQAYLDWRAETGVLEKVGTMLVDAPSFRFFEHVAS